MRVLRTISHWYGKCFAEIRARLKAALVGWVTMGAFWTTNVRRPNRYLIFYSIVINTAISGLEAQVLTKDETSRFNSIIVRKLRVLMRGNVEKETNGKYGC